MKAVPGPPSGWCRVCDGTRVVLLAPLCAPELATPTRCLHCGPRALPVVLSPDPARPRLVESTP